MSHCFMPVSTAVGWIRASVSYPIITRTARGLRAQMIGDLA